MELHGSLPYSDCKLMLGVRDQIASLGRQHILKLGHALRNAPGIALAPTRRLTNVDR